MITHKRLLFLFACLTFVLLVACEPLAPEQTPRYIVVTGETPGAGVPTPTFLLGGAADSSPGPAGVETSVPAIAAGTVNTPVPSETPTSPPVTPTEASFFCAESAGRVIEASFFSAVAGTDVSYRMYQPPCFYDTLQRYPYVILLHGTGYDDAMWIDLNVPEIMDQGIANGTLPPMVLIMPDGGFLSELNDQPDGNSYESLILDELMPAVEADFCVWGGRQGRAIGGISRGGFWAFSIALRHPDLFSAVGGHSPHFEDDNAPPESNPLTLASRVNLDEYPLRIYLDHAAEDYVSPNAIRMSEILRAGGIEHEYLINPTGNHDVEYWGAHVAEYLSFYGQAWPLDVMALPSCLEPNPE